MQILRTIDELHEVEQQRLHVAKHFLPVLTQKAFVADEQGKCFQPFPVPVPLNALCSTSAAVCIHGVQGTSLPP